MNWSGTRCCKSLICPASKEEYTIGRASSSDPLTHYRYAELAHAQQDAMSTHSRFSAGSGR
jgi:hypothetical protein